MPDPLQVWCGADCSLLRVVGTVGARAEERRRPRPRGHVGKLCGSSQYVEPEASLVGLSLRALCAQGEEGGVSRKEPKWVLSTM